ncbi:hypothetical protein [Pontixanthobacter sp.]|uniref:gasdermin n=1 Tax=Pontixanthobacter sp. TaxID=2792078 RepID=UPI003C79C4FD
MASSWQKSLAQLGYTPIRLPSADFDIFTLVYEHDSRRGHDNAFHILTAGATGTRPVPRRNIAAAMIEGTAKRIHNISIGLSILQGLLSALGGAKMGLSIGFENASEVTFSYADVTKDIVSAVELEMFLRTAKAPDSGLLKGWLDDNLWIMTSVLKSKKIEVTAKDSHGQNLELDVPVIRDAIGGNLKVSRPSSSSTGIAFEGEVPLPFAAQVYKVRRFSGDDPDSLSLREAKAGSVVLKSMAAKSADDMQIADDIPLILPDVLENGIGTSEM